MTVDFQELSRLSLQAILGDRYRVLELAGTGGQAEVWRCEDLTAGRFVAVKVLRLPNRQFPVTKDLKPLEREAQSLAKIQHNHVMRLFDVVSNPRQTEQRFFCLITEWLSGGSLRDWIKLHPRPDVTQTVQMMEQIASGLMALHAAGIVHRDVTPSNILFDHVQVPKLADLGLSRWLRQDGGTQTEFEPGGTPSYASPEQMSPNRRQQRTLDARSDVYGLGATLYAVLCGRPPFMSHGQSERDWDAIRLQVCDLDLAAPDPRIFRPELPADLAAICLKALNKDVQDRYQSMAEMRDDLGRFARGEPVHARRQAFSTLLRHVARKIRKNAIAILGLGMPVAAVLTFVVYHDLLFPLPPLSVAGHPVDVVLSDALNSYHSPAIDAQGTAVIAVRVPNQQGRDVHEHLVLFRNEDGTAWKESTAELPPFTGGQTHPAWSPSGNSIAFFCKDLQQVFVMSMIESDSRRNRFSEPAAITTVSCGIAYTLSLSWLDESHILLTDFRPADGNKGLRVVALDRSLPDKWIAASDSQTGIQQGAVSPSGSRISFTGPQVDFTASIYSGEVEQQRSVAAVQITRREQVADQSEQPNWFDEKTLCFTSAHQGGFRLSVAERNDVDGLLGLNPWRVWDLPLPGAQNVQQISLSRASGQLAFAERHTADRIYVLRSLGVASGEPSKSDFHELAGRSQRAAKYRDWEPEWSRSCNRLLFVSDEGTPGFDRIWCSCSDGGSAFAFKTEEFDRPTEHSRRPRRYTPRQAPDGRRLLVTQSAALGTRDGEYVMSTLLPEGWERLDPQQIPSLKFVELIDGSKDYFHDSFHPAWSHDGTQVAFCVQARQGKSILQDDVVIGLAKLPGLNVSATRDSVKWLFSDDLAMEERPNWSPDGRWLVCEGVRSGSGWDVFLIDPEMALSEGELRNGQTINPRAFRPLTRECVNERSPRWVKHDGKDYVYYVRDYQTLCRREIPAEFLEGRIDESALPPAEHILDLAGKTLMPDCFSIADNSLYVSVRSPASEIKTVRLSRRHRWSILR